MRRLRPTYLSLNKSVTLPDPLPQTEEIEIQELKQDILKTTQSYIQEHKHKMKHSNLTNSEKEGLTSLMKKKNDIIISQTDKSGRISVDSVNNYVKGMKIKYIMKMTQL